MVVAAIEPDGRFTVLDRAKEMVRLGSGTLSKGVLSDRAMENGVRTLSAFRTLADRLDVTRIQAVATSAVREAANGGDFIRRVKHEVGWRVRVIQGQEEARLIYLGVRHAMDLVTDSPSLIVDIGGGSVEVILVEDGQAVWLDSLKLGVARLSDRYLPNDPPRDADLATLNRVIDEELADSRKAIHDRVKAVPRIIGTSGTMLNLIAMAGHEENKSADGKPHNLEVGANRISRVRRAVCRTDRSGRQKIPGLDSKRADLIVAGACVAERIIKTVSAKRVVGCTWALREGVLLDFIERHQKGIEELGLYESPRIRSVVRLARHLGETSRHGSQVAELALSLFDQLEATLELGAASREWLHYAALLHDVGHHIAHSNHHRHSHYLISNGELLGFEPSEIEMIALLARYHRKAPPKDSDPELAKLSPELRPVVRALSAILRVADSLDRSHFGVVKGVTVERSDNRITIRLDTGSDDAALEIWEAQQRSKLLRQVTGCEIVFATRNGVVAAAGK